jgi:hypothetical protein
MLRSEPAGSDSDLFGVERRPGEVKPMSDSPLCEIPQPGTLSGKTKMEKVANGGREIMTAGNARTPVNDEILTISEVAKHLRCSRAHVYNSVAGKVVGVSPLPVITMGRRKLVRRSTLEAWERDNEKAVGSAMLPASPDVDAVRRIERTAR